MATLKDFLDLSLEAESRARSFGENAFFQKELRTHLDNVTEAICRENRKNRDEALHLPSETLLGPGSNLALGKMKIWLHKKQPVIDPHTLVSI